MSFRATIQTLFISSLACAFSLVASLTAVSASQAAKDPKGKIGQGVYTPPARDYRVAVPNANALGPKVRDEGNAEIWQVIFTDDLGGFFRLLSLRNPHGEFTADSVLAMKPYAGAFDKEIVNTARGREVRFIDMEKEGAEITISTARKLLDGSIAWDTKTPDLVTANAAFEANGRLYHLIAGVAQMEKMDQQTAVARAKQGLEKFLSGLELLKPQK